MDKSVPLAIHGGSPAITRPLPKMYPGGMHIGQEEADAVLDVIRSKRLFRYYGPHSGPSKVEALEKAFASHMGASFAVAVSSGTAALICGLAALEIGPGDEVIVPAYTWIASAEAVLAVGAIPIIAEIDNSLTLDTADIARKITPHTRAILPVHMRGLPCDMNGIMALAAKHKLKVIEDAAQADGASLGGKRLGTFGQAGAFSFQFNKIITCGEGGMVITNEEDLYQRMVMVHDVVGGLRNNIPAPKILPGLNFRMSEIQGALMLVQLERLELLLADMRHHKALLTSALAESAARKGISFPAAHDPSGDAAVALVFFAPTAADAVNITQALNAEGLPASNLYRPDKTDYHVYAHWAPVINQASWSPARAPWAWHEPVHYTPDLCPTSLDLLSRTVHIDISPDLTNENLEEMAEALNKVVNAIL